MPQEELSLQASTTQEQQVSFSLKLKAKISQTISIRPGAFHKIQVHMHQV